MLTDILLAIAGHESGRCGDIMRNGVGIGVDIAATDDDNEDDDAIECNAGRSGLDDIVDAAIEDGAMNRDAEGDGGSNKGFAA
ncbi:hypothetical protein BGX20_004171 [Mortierella sp. AD010]|nr:hypothetical protein BGX20_004171 [Mortierella sp. AD010]